MPGLLTPLSAVAELAAGPVINSMNPIISKPGRLKRSVKVHIEEI